MKSVKKIIAVALAFAIALSASVVAFAEGENVVEKIHFESINDDELAMNELSQNGDGKIAIAYQGSTNYSIVIPDNCDAVLQNAVGVLQDALKNITGADFNFVNHSNADFSKPNIIISVIDSEGKIDDADSQGFNIKIDSSGVSIFGFTSQGVSNGIYSFIENQLGCIFLTPEDTYYPSQPTVFLEMCDESSKPATLWRDVYAYETVQDNWASKLRLNGVKFKTQSIENPAEGLQYNGWGTWCHNCYQYLSPDDYYDEHPEYFSYIEKTGKRVTEYEGRPAYLCLSNPEVYNIVEKSLAKMIAENPDQMYWDFSGNDNPALAGCECENCKKADQDAGGTGMGTLLPFLNKLARAFPDKYISTLAYLHTLKAPTSIKAESNVVIKLCSMPGDQSSSYLDGANANANQFKEQVEEWSKITDKIVVWDYVVNFSHLLMPFPNFAVQQKNQRFYEDNGIIGIFHQASREKGGELACLRAYVLSHLMWEGSQMDVAKCVSKYISAYFGNASPKVIEYMNMCADNLVESKNWLGLYDGLMSHYNGYLSPDNVKAYYEVLNTAKEIVKGDTIMESRLEEIELPIAYATVLMPEISKTERNEALETVNRLCKNRQITMVCEWDSLESFNQNSLKNIVKGEKREIYKVQRAIIIATASVIGAGIAVTILITIIKKIKRKKSNKV